MIFTLNDAQMAKLHDWKMKHACAVGNNVGAIGGKYTYCFNVTGIGVVCKVKCACGAELDLTDYSDW